MLSIIIPAYREPYLNKTIDSLLKNAVGEIEILPVIDGYTPTEPVRVDPRVKPIIVKKNAGMRAAENLGISKAIGEYILQCDAHCVFAKGYDKVLIEDCEDNWLMIPSRYFLDEKNWDRIGGRHPSNYHYLSFPLETSYGLGMWVSEWQDRREERKEYDIDDDMTMQESCWFANKKYFMEHIWPLDDRPETYGSFVAANLEIGLKYWLGGGAVKINKRTWYAHLDKRGHHYMKRMFSRRHKKDEYVVKCFTWATKHWINDREPNMIHPFSWLIEKFNPPGWEGDWEKRIAKFK